MPRKRSFSQRGKQKREKARLSKRKQRTEDVEKREIDRERNANSMRERRQDDTHRAMERCRNAEYMRRRRQNPILRNEERYKNALYMRQRRESSTFREEERHRNVKYMRKRRDAMIKNGPNMSLRYSKKQATNQTENEQSEEELMDNTNGNDNDNSEYESSSQNSDTTQGPTWSCSSCEHLFFKKSISTLNTDELPLITMNFLTTDMSFLLEKDPLILCCTCKNAIKKRKIPRLCVIRNDRQITEIPNLLTILKLESNS